MGQQVGANALVLKKITLLSGKGNTKLPAARTLFSADRVALPPGRRPQEGLASGEASRYFLVMSQRYDAPLAVAPAARGAADGFPARRAGTAHFCSTVFTATVTRRPAGKRETT